jgi:hypothetical protein
MRFFPKKKFSKTEFFRKKKFQKLRISAKNKLPKKYFFLLFAENQNTLSPKKRAK